MVTRAVLLGSLPLVRSSGRRQRSAVGNCWTAMTEDVQVSYVASTWPSQIKTFIWRRNMLYDMKV